MIAAAQSARTFWSGLPGGLRRWAVGMVAAIGIGAVVITQNGNDVKDYLSQQGFEEISNVEVSTQIRTIRVDLDSTNVTYAMSVCEALRGRFSDGKGGDMGVRILFNPPYRAATGSANQPCQLEI